MHSGRLSACIGAAVVAASLACPARAQSGAIDFRIEPGTLSAVLQSYAIQSGDQVLIPDDIGANVMSDGVIGRLSRRAALRRILRNTGYAAFRASGGVLSFRRAPRASDGRSVSPPGRQAGPDDAASTTPQAAAPRNATIVVTARKRDETDLEVPIVIDAFDALEIDRRNIRSLEDLATHTPELNVSIASGNSSGAMTLRGIGTPTAGPGTDQAVAISIDGITLADGLFLRLAQFDLERIEILQGPQSLYYGKNSSGGIISLTTADPGAAAYAMVRTGYTFQSREKLAEGVLSGPLTDTVRARLAFYHADQDGYFVNPLASNTSATPDQEQLNLFGPLPAASSKRAPQQRNSALRATLLVDAADRATIRLKGTYSRRTGTDSWAGTQLFYCASGQPAPGLIGNVDGIGDCDLDRRASPVGQNVDAAVGGDPLYRDGRPYLNFRHYLLSGAIDYQLGDDLTLSAVSGYYDFVHRAAELVTASPYPALGSTITLKRKDYTQELRLLRDGPGPVNGMVGLYYQYGDFFSTVSANLLGSNLEAPAYLVDLSSHAVFGQLSYTLPGDTIVISAGGRYTNERKSLSVRFGDMAIEDLLARKTVHSRKFSPELSLSWQPTGGTNLFVTYKRGTKSGGFNLSALLPANYEGADISFADENAEGIEGGIKTLLIGGSLRFDLTAYRYTYDDLQVTVYDPLAAVTSTRNAASARIAGLQFSANYAPRTVRGLSLRGSVNYGHARFADYLAGCYTGQTGETGCIYDAEGRIVAEDAVAQDLSGRALTAAPDWSGHLATNYEFPVGLSDKRIGISAGVTYRGRYQVVYNQPPDSSQGAAANLDTALRLFDDKAGWELALIGNNLTNRLRVKWGIEAPLTPNGEFINIYDPSRIPGLRSDLIGVTNAPRTIMLRFTLAVGER